MALQAGARLGPYEIVAAIGSGGMGEVYRAHDTKLGRDVAIKILPQTFSADPERRARFDREARVLAALNHPNIASIYTIEEPASGTGVAPALVLELVEGATLADRLAGGRPLPLADALVIARQIAEALSAAHERGVVHRDLKPANVKAPPGGLVKVLDFGLARLADPAAAPANISMSPTTLVSMPGVLMGTAAYMAPEQTKGEDVD